MGVRTRFTTQGRPLVARCERVNGVLVFIKSGELIDDVSECWLCNDSAPWIWFVYFIISGWWRNLIRSDIFSRRCVCVCVTSLSVSDSSLRYWFSPPSSCVCQLFSHPLLFIIAVFHLSFSIEYLWQRARNSLVDIVSRYRLDGPEFESL